MWSALRLTALASLMLLSLFGCTASSEQLNVSNDKSEATITKLQTELADIKSALSAANKRIDDLQTSLSKAQAPIAKDQAAAFKRLLSSRRSVREYSDLPLVKEQVMQLVWAGQGISGDMGARTAPSAGAFYPLTLYVVAGKVTDLATGLYKYSPAEDRLILVNDKDLRSGLAEAAYGQQFIKQAAIDIVIVATYERTAEKYGVKAERFVNMEAGHAAQNILIEATALYLGSSPVGGFDDGKVAITLGLPRNESPLYIIPVGIKR